MTDQTFVEGTIQDSFQERSTGQQDYVSSSIPVIGRLAIANDIIAPWWSYARDRQLKAFWMENDYLSGAMYTMNAKMTAIPFRVIPDDYSDPEKVMMAQLWTEHLYDAPEFGAGWEMFYGMWVQNLVGYDNGAFAEITGAGDVTGPIRGAPGTVEILDSMQCMRTSNPIYPVIYSDTDGKRYKLHYTRVMLDSQLPSTDVWMNKVGLCAISRAINIGQNLLDIAIYKMEKLGSRPNRSLGITKGGLDPNDVQMAMDMGNAAMTTKGLRRYSQMIVLGSASQPDADLAIKDLASLPDGFDEKTSIVLGMATVALAFGMDARELFPAMQDGATRADALLQHIKQRGKGPGQILQSTERLFSRKFLPPYLKLVFDFQDDTQDRQEAEIEKLRSERRQRDLGTGITDARTEREKMLQWGDIDQSQFARLELEDGRLIDGTSVLSLFFSDNEMIGSMLDNPFDNILNIDNNDPMKIFEYINERRAEISRMLANSRSMRKIEAARQALAALKELGNEYMQDNLVPDKPEPVENRMYPTRREDLTTPNQAEELGNNDEPTEMHQDDSPVVKGGSESNGPFEIKSVSDYETSIRGPVRGLWNGQIDIYDFSSMLASAVRRGLRQAAEEGARENGILPGELTESELSVLDGIINEEITYVDQFGDAVEANSKANDGRLESFEWRIALWVNRYNEVKTMFQTITGGDKKYIWHMYAHEHCESCKKLNGKVKRASEWQRNNVYPRHRTKLACMVSAHGVSVCKCELEETDEPCTPGPLPALP